jgi:DNA-binding SARP family transcriptional activator/TolB-like protein
MTCLDLRTLGGVALLRAGVSIERPAITRKPLALLVLLASAGIRGLTRDKLLGYLWPEADEERGRSVLRQTVYALRRDLGSPDLLLSSAASIRLNPEVIRTDLAAFNEAAAAGDWDTAAELYRGPFADGFYLAEAPEFERWIETERQDLEARLRRGLDGAARRAVEAGDHQVAAEWWRRVLRYDPLNSRTAVELIEALERSGQPGLALEAAREHGDVLQAELGTGVGAPIADAVQRISAGLSHPSLAGPAPTMRVPVAAAVLPDPRTPSASLPRPPRVRQGRALAAAVLGILGLAALASTRRDDSADPRAGAGLTDAGRRRTLAIVPFADSSPSRASGYRARALTDQVGRQLAGIGALRVQRTATGSPADLRLNGVFRLEDARFEIDVSLSDGKSGRPLWTGRHAGAAPDLPGVQAEVARDVASALGLSLTAAERRRIERVPTASAEAYDLFLRSTGLSTVHRTENLAGIALLEQAVRRDTSFAIALATLARRFMFQAYLVDPTFGDSGMAAVQRAIAADSGLGEAWFALGDLQGLAGHPSAARLSYLKAIDLDPGQLPAMVDLSDVDASLGRLDEALYWALRAVRQDPASPGFRSHLVAALYYLRADDAAERSMLDAEQRWPDYERFPIWLARLDFVRGRDSAAMGRLRRYVLRDPGNEEAAVALAAFAALTGAADGEALVQERLRTSPGAKPYGPAKVSFPGLLALTRRRQGDLTGARILEDSVLAAAKAREAAGGEDLTFATERAAIHALRGDSEALTWLERAYAAGERDYGWLAVDPFFEPFRRQARFRQILSRMQTDVAAMRRRATEADDSVF